MSTTSCETVIRSCFKHLIYATLFTFNFPFATLPYPLNFYLLLFPTLLLLYYPTFKHILNSPFAQSSDGRNNYQCTNYQCIARYIIPATNQKDLDPQDHLGPRMLAGYTLRMDDTMTQLQTLDFILSIKSISLTLRIEM